MLMAAFPWGGAELRPRSHGKRQKRPQTGAPLPQRIPAVAALTASWKERKDPSCSSQPGPGSVPALHPFKDPDPHPNPLDFSVSAMFPLSLSGPGPSPNPPKFCAPKVSLCPFQDLDPTPPPPWIQCLCGVPLSLPGPGAPNTPESLKSPYDSSRTWIPNNPPLGSVPLKCPHSPSRAQTPKISFKFSVPKVSPCPFQDPNPQPQCILCL